MKPPISNQKVRAYLRLEDDEATADLLTAAMRQVHPGCERLFVDYAGQSVPVLDPSTGEIRRAQVFVVALGASNYSYG